VAARGVLGQRERGLGEPPGEGVIVGGGPHDECAVGSQGALDGLERRAGCGASGAGVLWRLWPLSAS
jgi:hypothetical protein